MSLVRSSCHCDGVKRQKQSAFKQHLFLDYFATLVMTKAKMVASHKASRHDNTEPCRASCTRFLSLRAVQNARCGNLLVSDRHTTFAMTTLNLPHASCHCDDNLFFRDICFLEFERNSRRSARPFAQVLLS